MSNEKNYPRAERETVTPNPDGLIWRIQQRTSPTTISEHHVCLIDLARMTAFEAAGETGPPAAAVLALIDAAIQRDKLEAALSQSIEARNEIAMELNRIKDGNSGLLDRAVNAEKALANAHERYEVTVAALGIPKGVDHASVLRQIVTIRAQVAERQEALQQLHNLGQFIGHPGATPAHVVSETVSLIEKFVNCAYLHGFRTTGEKPCQVAEVFVAESRKVAEKRRESAGIPTAPAAPLAIDEALAALLGARQVLGNVANIQHAIDLLTDAKGVERMPCPPDADLETQTKFNADYVRAMAGEKPETSESPVDRLRKTLGLSELYAETAVIREADSVIRGFLNLAKEEEYKLRKVAESPFTIVVHGPGTVKFGNGIFEVRGKPEALQVEPPV